MKQFPSLIYQLHPGRQHPVLTNLRETKPSHLYEIEAILVARSP